MRKAWLISLSNVGKVEGKYLSRLTELALCKQHRFFLSGLLVVDAYCAAETGRCGAMSGD